MLTEYIRIPIDQQGVAAVLLSVSFDVDTTHESEYSHRWELTLNYENEEGELSKDIRMLFDDVHFLFALREVFDFLRDDGCPIGSELLSDIRWYKRTIIPHLENPEILLRDGEPTNLLQSGELLYLDSCSKIHSQNHIITIMQNEGFVWTR